MDDCTPERWELHYSGRVQGVGFRYTVRMLAGRFDVAGFVRNLRDGRVELVVEGSATELLGLLDAIDREMGHHVTDARRTTRSERRTFPGLSVR